MSEVSAAGCPTGTYDVDDVATLLKVSSWRASGKKRFLVWNPASTRRHRAPSRKSTESSRRLASDWKSAKTMRTSKRRERLAKKKGPFRGSLSKSVWGGSNGHNVIGQILKRQYAGSHLQENRDAADAGGC